MKFSEFRETLTKEQVEDQNFTRFCYVMAKIITKYIDEDLIPDELLKKIDESIESDNKQTVA